MKIKLKICGVKRLEDAIELNKIGVDYIGIVNESKSIRFAPYEFNKIVKIYVDKPVVSVRVSGDINEILSRETVADYIQIHRVLTDEELEALSAYDTKRVILYVPTSLDYIPYLLKIQRYNTEILFDSPKKGVVNDPKILRILLDYHRDAGVGGGINLENIYNYIVLEPKWIDVSSGVEISPGVKDLNKVKALKEVIDSWKVRI